MVVVEALPQVARKMEEMDHPLLTQINMDLVALTQYFDSLQVLGTDSRVKVIFLPSNPGAIGNYMNEIRTALASSLEADGK